MTSLDVAQQGYAAFMRGDIQGVLALCDPDIRWIYHAATPWAGEFRGHEGVARFFQILADHLDFEVFEPREFVAEGGKVAVLGITRARAKGAGEAVENNWAHLFDVRDGRIVRFVGHDTVPVQA